MESRRGFMENGLRPIKRQSDFFIIIGKSFGFPIKALQNMVQNVDDAIIMEYTL